MPDIIPTLLSPDAVQVSGERITTTSLRVADHFDKLHKNVLRDINRLDCSEKFNGLNFEPVKYLDQKGEERSAYEMTKDGFMFLVMGFTGKKAAAVKEAYIEAFNEMERQLQQQQQQPAGSPFERIDTKTMSILQKQDKELAWKYLESLGIEKPAGVVSTGRNFGMDVIRLVRQLRGVVRDHDPRHFFVEVADMEAITQGHRRQFVNWLLDEGYLLPGEYVSSLGYRRKARKISKTVSPDLRRVYVINRDLFDLLEVNHAS